MLGLEHENALAQFVSAIDIGLGNTKWPIVTIRRPMECIDEIAKFVVEQPGPNVRSLQINPARVGRYVPHVRSAFALVACRSRHTGDHVAETKDAIELTIEVPGVDEKDINVSLDGNQLVISGEKKEETKKDEKDWHVEERSYGSFYRSMSLPFKPDEGAIEAHLRQGRSPPQHQEAGRSHEERQDYRDQTWHTYKAAG